MAVFLLSPWWVSAQVIGGQPYFTEVETTTYTNLSNDCEFGDTTFTLCRIPSLGFTTTATTTVGLGRFLVNWMSPDFQSTAEGIYIYLYPDGQTVNSGQRIVYLIATSTITRDTQENTTIYEILPYSCPSYGCKVGIGDWDVVFEASNYLPGNPTGRQGITLRTDTAYRPYYTISASSTINHVILTDFVQQNYQLFATSTVEDFCDQNVPYDDSSIIQATLTAIPNGLCRVGVFLVVPTGDQLNQFGELNDTLATKIPFSYFYEVKDIYEGGSASTTENFTSFSIGLASIDFASSTGIGPILPTNLNFLSTSTINTYLPAGMHDVLYNIMVAAIWLEVMYLLYHRIVPKTAKI